MRAGDRGGRRERRQRRRRGRRRLGGATGRRGHGRGRGSRGAGRRQNGQPAVVDIGVPVVVLAVDNPLTVIGVGVEVTLTFTVLLIVSVVPSQLRVKLRLAVSELMICDPDLPLLPLQSPDAVQLSALLVDQDSVTLPL